MSNSTFVIEPIGEIRSTLLERKNAPRQSFKGAPEATLVIDPRFSEGVADLKVGDEIFVLTWLHLARRETMRVRPGNDPNTPLTGVFATRSPDRPNPVGLHWTKILEIDGLELRVAGLEAVDGTPIVDIKPVLEEETRLR